MTRSLILTHISPRFLRGGQQPRCLNQRRKGNGLRRLRRCQAVRLSKQSKENRAVADAADNGMFLRVLRQRRNWHMLASTRVVAAAVAQNGNALRYANESHQNNETIVLAAIKNDPTAFQYASASLKKNQSFCFRAASANPWPARCFSPKMRSFDIGEWRSGPMLSCGLTDGRG